MTKPLSDADKAVFDRVREAHPEPIELKRDEAKPLIDAGRITQAKAGGRGKKGTYRLSQAYEWAGKQEEAAKNVPPDSAGIGHNLSPDISHTDFRAILNELQDDKHAIDEATGRYRSAIKRVLDDREWNKTGFGMILSLFRMSETSRADVLRTLVPLLDLMMEHEWNSELRDMVDQMEGDQGGGSSVNFRGEDGPQEDPDAEAVGGDGPPNDPEGDPDFDDEGKAAAEAIGEGGEAPEPEDDSPDTFGDQLQDEHEPA